MTKSKGIASFALIFLTAFGLVFTSVSCSKKNNSPQAVASVSPSAGSTSTVFTLDASQSRDEEDNGSQLQIQLDWEGDGIYETDWVSEKVHQTTFDSEGEFQVNIRVKDTDGEITQTSANLSVTNSPSLIPDHSPFNYNVGINYESWPTRPHRVVARDLDQITKYFKLIRTYHGAGVFSADTILDPTMIEVINYVVANPVLEIELSVGTNNSALNKAGAAGYMVNRAYTDKWVQQLIAAFGSVANTKTYVKVILLGNEIDRNAPGAPGSALFNDYIHQWIPQSFDNMKASLAAAGMSEIPVSTTISNYPSDPSANLVSSTSVKYIHDNWSPQWNSGDPFVFFNQYTQNMKDTDFGYDINYFELVASKLAGSPSVYVGETGYDATFGVENQVKVVKQIFNWLDGQYGRNKITVPLFLFQAFDLPIPPPGTATMFGIFKDNEQNVPEGLKSGIAVPEWIVKPKG